MGYTPYDWNENLQHRLDYVERKLRQGSPVVGHAYRDGLLLVSVRKTQRKIFEVYDHILYSAIGNPSEVESIRVAAIDFAHQEGFNRSPDDVSVQRIVVGLSPTLKKALADAFSTPFVFRCVFAELGHTQDKDQFTTLNYDGEYFVHKRFAVVAGTNEAEERMREKLQEGGDDLPSLEDAVRTSLEAWSVGRLATQRPPGSISNAREDDEEESRDAPTPQSVLADVLKDGFIEVGVLERRGKEARFRLMSEDEISRLRV